MAGLPSSVRWLEVRLALPGRPLPLLALARWPASRRAQIYRSRLRGSPFFLGPGRFRCNGEAARPTLAGWPDVPPTPSIARRLGRQLGLGGAAGCGSPPLLHLPWAAVATGPPGWHGQPPLAGHPPSSLARRPARGRWACLLTGAAAARLPPPLLSHNHSLSLSPSLEGGRDLPATAAGPTVASGDGGATRGGGRTGEIEGKGIGRSAL